MRALAYAFACLVVPTLWALVVFHFFGWLEKRRPAPSVAVPPRRRDDELPPIDYMI